MTESTPKQQKDRRGPSLREQQLAVTRERIISALARLIEKRHPLEITMAAVATEAGVSEPTLYRHFPSKRDLFRGLGAHLYRRTTHGVAPASVDELAQYLPELYKQFAGMEPIIRWNLSAPKDEAIRPDAADRMPILEKAVGEVLKDLPDDESQHLLRGLLLLTAPNSMLYWQDYLDLDADEAAETASWLLRRLAGTGE